MKNNTPMSQAIRQKNCRKRLGDSDGTRFSVALSADAADALDSITQSEGITKRAAIEKALDEYWARYCS